MSPGTMGGGWDVEGVLAASNEWVWVPESARHVRTHEYLVVACPEYFLAPTSGRVFGSERDAVELTDEICAVAREWGRDRLWWRLSEFTRPDTLEQELETRGAAVEERTDVLALPLADGVPDLAVPGDVAVRQVTDEPAVGDALEVVHDAFGGHEPTDEQVATSLAEVEAGLADGSGGRWVDYVDGRPASTGGYTLAEDVCRLWGGGTLALTHGVVDTSSPILRRLGFTRYGEERTLALDLT